MRSGLPSWRPGPSAATAAANGAGWRSRGRWSQHLEFRVSGSAESALAALRERGIARPDSFAVGARVTVPLHEHAASAALAVIDAERLRVSEIATRVPTLDDVYLEMTGQRLSN
ncbi:MAG TPA: hypothetical protein VEF89_02165 [Solirubrobacteraceae bacterium]|nr:hypothetical protein [Solirubrobacteraceae bacterium]